jgi:hypothetical protein
MSHGDTVLKPPVGFTSLASTDNCPVAAMADPARRLFAVQFHPEVVHTPQGKTVLKNFLDAAGATGDWSMPSFVESAVESIRQQVGRDRVLCALSGGVDSSVVAALIHRAIGDQLTCLFVDNGLLRKGQGRATASSTTSLPLGGAYGYVGTGGGHGCRTTCSVPLITGSAVPTGARWIPAPWPSIQVRHPGPLQTEGLRAVHPGRVARSSVSATACGSWDTSWAPSGLVWAQVGGQMREDLACLPHSGVWWPLRRLREYGAPLIVVPPVRGRLHAHRAVR